MTTPLSTKSLKRFTRALKALNLEPNVEDVNQPAFVASFEDDQIRENESEGTVLHGCETQREGRPGLMFLMKLHDIPAIRH